MKKSVWIIFFCILIIILLALAYYIFLYPKSCLDQACFDSSLERCQKVSFVKENSDSVMRYNILGKESKDCLVSVKLIRMKQGSQELSKLEGKEMTCSTLLGSRQDPISNIADCHGLLKEQIQDIILKRMHSQIVENLGQITNETTKVL